MSRHLLNPPLTYRIDRLIPKPFWKFWGSDSMEEQALDARLLPSGPADPGGLYESYPLWQLPAPSDQTGHSEFRAQTDSGEAYSGILCSARMWLEEEDRTTASQKDMAAFATPGAVLVKPKIQTNRGKTQRWVARAPEDPPVRIRILQGSDVIEYLRAVEAELGAALGIGARSMEDLPPETMTYFVDRPLNENTYDRTIGPGSPVDIEVQLPLVSDLRAAIALEVVNLEDATATRTPPIFATAVGDGLILTDLTLDMLRPEPRRLLSNLAERNGDVAGFAAELGEDVTEVWQRLVEATEELGAGSVGEAVSIAAFGTLTPVDA
jgi:hypothetical protein